MSTEKRAVESPHLDDQSELRTLNHTARSNRYGLIGGSIGAIIGAVVPFVYGAYCICSVRSVAADLPDYAVDGTPAAVGTLIILFGSPIAAICLFVFGYLIGRCVELFFFRFVAYRRKV